MDHVDVASATPPPSLVGLNGDLSRWINNWELEKFISWNVEISTEIVFELTKYLGYFLVVLTFPNGFFCRNSLGCSDSY